MAKKVSKWFRIGVEGDTCDGRVISATDIQEMADSSTVAVLTSSTCAACCLTAYLNAMAMWLS